MPKHPISRNLLQMLKPQMKIVNDLAALVEEGAGFISAEAQRAIGQKGFFALSLSGGNTPRPVYERLTRPPYDQSVDWRKVRIFFGDERCVPPDSEQSNYRMALQSMLSKLPIPGGNVFRIRGEIDPNPAATEYGLVLKEQFGDGGLDLVLLGMGPDGHTASLFPGTIALSESKHRCIANYVQKLSAWRVTMSAPFINRSTAVMFLVSGAEKAPKVQEILHGPENPQLLPSQLIQPRSGRLIWLLDGDAASRLSPSA